MSGKLETPFELAEKCIWIAGHNGLVGQALARRLESEQCKLITVSHDELDLRRQSATEDWLAANRPDVIIVAAATVGGILANSIRPAEFIYNNLAILTNIIEAARRTGVQKLLMLGSSCIYPRLAKQPMSEDELLAGPLEPTNQWYAVAKIAGIKLCEAYRRQYGCDFISAMPTNLFGPGDNFDLESSHVVPALIRKIDEAQRQKSSTVTIWGTGTVRREFIYVDDCADALVYLLKHYSAEGHINVGTGEDVTITELAETIARVVGYEGQFEYDTSKPDGTPRKLLDVTRLNDLGWKSHIDLPGGLTETYQWYSGNRTPKPVTSR